MYRSRPRQLVHYATSSAAIFPSDSSAPSGCARRPIGTSIPTYTCTRGVGAYERAAGAADVASIGDPDAAAAVCHICVASGAIARWKPINNAEWKEEPVLG